jgi:hypothetical protein
MLRRLRAILVPTVNGAIIRGGPSRARARIASKVPERPVWAPNLLRCPCDRRSFPTAPCATRALPATHSECRGQLAVLPPVPRASRRATRHQTHGGIGCRRSVVFVRHCGPAQRLGRTKGKGSLRQLPRQHSPLFARLAPPRLLRTGWCLNRRCVLGKHDDPSAVQEPKKPALIDSGERPLPIAPE